MVDKDYVKNILNELNLVRTDPKSFAAKIRNYEQYFKGNILRIPGQNGIKTNEGYAAFKEAAEFLEKQIPIGPLIFNTYLNSISDEVFSIIEKSSDADAFNSINIDELISKYGSIAGQFSQAIDFGSNSAELIVINLIVDDGDSNRGNRSNILNPKFSIVGISSGKHKTYHYCTVIAYCRHFIPKGEDPGDLSDDCYEKSDTKKKVTEDKKFVSVPVQQETKNQVPKYIYVKEEKGDDFNLEKDVEKMEISEKSIIDEGVKKILVKEVKYYKDGTVNTSIYKKNN